MKSERAEAIRTLLDDTKFTRPGNEVMFLLYAIRVLKSAVKEIVDELEKEDNNG